MLRDSLEDAEEKALDACQKKAFASTTPKQIDANCMFAACTNLMLAYLIVRFRFF